jgi:hypothetical protein
MSTVFRCALPLMAAIALCRPASAQTLGPTSYLSFNDGPFAAVDFSGNYFHLENFEDGALNTPGVTVNAGQVTSPGPFTDSVDGDDGSVDGSGVGGSSFLTGGLTNQFTFTFNAAALGGILPTHVGVVWTDVGTVSAGTTGFGNVTFTAYDATNILIGTVGPTLLGDGAANGGGTSEDRFFGVINSGGISRITIQMPDSTDWEIDHLQYGAVPAPGALLVGLVGSVPGVFALLRRRKV